MTDRTSGTLADSFSLRAGRANRAFAMFKPSFIMFVAVRTCIYLAVLLLAFWVRAHGAFAVAGVLVAVFAFCDHAAAQVPVAAGLALGAREVFLAECTLLLPAAIQVLVAAGRALGV
jgi:hypothetical protein